MSHGETLQLLYDSTWHDWRSSMGPLSPISATSSSPSDSSPSVPPSSVSRSPGPVESSSPWGQGGLQFTCPNDQVWLQREPTIPQATCIVEGPRPVDEDINWRSSADRGICPRFANLENVVTHLLKTHASALSSAPELKALWFPCIDPELEA